MMTRAPKVGIVCVSVHSLISLGTNCKVIRAILRNLSDDRHRQRDKQTVPGHNMPHVKTEIQNH